MDVEEEKEKSSEENLTGTSFITKSIYIYIAIYSIIIFIYLVFMLKTASSNYYNDINLPKWTLGYNGWIFINFLIFSLYSFGVYKASMVYDEKMSLINLLFYASYGIFLLIQTYYFVIKQSTMHFIFFVIMIGIISIHSYIFINNKKNGLLPLYCTMPLYIMLIYDILLYYKIWVETL